MTLVEPATNDDIARFYGGIALQGDWMGLVRRRGRLVVAAGGIFKRDDGPWRGFMDIPPHERGISVFRYALRLLREAKAAGAPSVDVVCSNEIPGAAKFLSRLGFEKTSRMEDDQAVWIWQG